MNKIECNICKREFDSKEALTMHNQSKHPQEIKKPMFSSNQKRKIKNWTYIIIVLGVIVGIVYLISSNIKTLPPIDMEGHIEEWPATQVQKSPIPIALFKHILEHTATPSKRPGVIISYNCRDYQCESSLIEKLEAFADENDYVFIAPFPKMDAKIVLTKLGKRQILEGYDEESIRIFIGG